MGMIVQVKEFFHLMEDYIRQDNAIGKGFEFVEKKTKIAREQLLRGVMAVTAVWLVIGYGSKFLCHMIGFLYPAYASVLAIESTGKDDDTRWLIYWVVFGLFCCVEFFFDIILFWFPLYNLLKCGFLMWCFAPTTYNGTYMIYYNIVQPYFLKYEQEIDQATGIIFQTAKDMAEKANEVIEETKALQEASDTWKEEEVVTTTTPSVEEKDAKKEQVEEEENKEL